MGYLEHPSHVAFVLVEANAVIAEARKRRWEAASEVRPAKKEGEPYNECSGNAHRHYTRKEVRRGAHGIWYCDEHLK